MALTLARLPFLPQLYEDEILSSWLDRFGLHYGMSRHDLAGTMPAGASDLSNLSDCDQSLSALSALTGMPKPAIARARLPTFVQQRNEHDARIILGNEKMPVKAGAIIPHRSG